MPAKTKYGTKFDYEITTGLEPTHDELMSIRASTKYRELRQQLNGLGSDDWLKIDLTGKEIDKGIELIRQAAYNWSTSDFIQLKKKGKRVQTFTAFSDNGNDVSLWMRIVEKEKK